MTDRTTPAGLDEHLRVPRPRPGRTLLVLPVAVLLLFAAGAATWEALDTVGPGRLDTRFLGSAVESRSDGRNTVAVTITEVGNTFAMAVLATLTGIRCWARGHRADTVFVVGTAAGAVLLFRGIKILVDRPRPPAVTQVVRETNESLPSGHATMSMVVIGSLVVLFWAGRGTAARVAMIAAGALWVGAVGSTRVYLGVHWFSDVLIGWLLGAAWLAACAATWSRWRRRALPSSAAMIRRSATALARRIAPGSRSEVTSAPSTSSSSSRARSRSPVRVCR